MSIWDRLQERDKSAIPSAEQALPGRSETMAVAAEHYVLGTTLIPPFPAQMQVLLVGMGCFWGAEKLFWQQPGVYSTAVGYAAGFTPNPTYEEVCSGMTGHNEVVQIIYDPSQASLESLLKVFWEGHNPTQGMRQGNDRGTQYRSGIYVPPGEGLALAKQSAARYQTLMTEAGLGKITTEIIPLPRFYYAEDYHQQYLAKNPSGYCGLIPIERSGQPRYPVGD